MASYTPNYNLKKPAGTDVVDIDDLNGNMDIIDTQLNSLNSNLSMLTTYMSQIIVPANGTASLPFNQFSIAIIIGLAQGQGQVCVIANGTTSGVSIINLFGGSVYSGSRITITREASDSNLVFTNSYSSASKFLVIGTGY